MIGITSYGGYIPRLRLDRMSIYQTMGWFAPAIVMVAQGERSFCNWDEDALTMAVAASRDCLVGQDKSRVDALFLCSTTLPFSDRLNAGIVKGALNLKDQLHAADFTSTLRAGSTGIIQALSAVKSGDRNSVLVTAADKRMAKTGYFYEMWFGDGAASVLVGDTGVVAEFLGSYTVTHDFVDHYRGAANQYDYMWEERWVRDEGYSKIIPEGVSGLLDKLSMSMDEVDRLIFPCFFKSEHRKISKKLGAAPEKVMDNLHEVCGETGAAHPLVMFVHALEEAKPGDCILMAGFGQGCDALCFRVTDEILNLPARQGIKGSLANKKTTDNYAKFLKFRDLIDTEMGIRAEAPTQTAMTVMWRKRDMILGLVGGRCTKCGTPQFPRMDICVNPKCRAVKSQAPYEFADVPASVKSFTGDLLAVSVDPPGIYGMIQFDGGGRFMADFTDCELSEVRVGQKVAMSFRRRYTDAERGFTGYFWKAVPLPEPEEGGVAKGEDIRFDGQVAIVTGAGAGLGRVYALELAARGARVVVNDIGSARDGSGEGSSSPADKVVEEIRSAGGEAVASYDSVATPEGGRAIVDTAVKAFGRVDILINNAGILRDKTLVKMEPENWDAVMDVHLKGAYNVTRPAFIKMRETGYGRIILTTSAAGLYGNFGQTNYSSAKMGLIGFMNTARLEGESHNIKINTIAPVAATRLTEDILPPDLLKKLKPEFVAPLVLYLCSEKCDDNGMIFNAGMGYFNRAAIVTGAGTVIGDGREIPTLEDIHHDWEKINSLGKGQEFPNATAAFGPMLDAFNPKKTEAPTEDEGGMTVAGIFDGISGAFQADKAAGVDAVFQFDISGPGGGSWYITVKDGNCEVTQGSHERPTTTIKMGDDDFVSLMRGELNAMSAFTSGKLKVEGDLMKSQLIEKLFRF
ncbi:MAG: SDR family NAD(P)-dependent oxidoreductase [Deltaproteobacteria bacterium]|nr:SDR family NAD(P)-dependent oxidoreductase [Deltaproteobacteria bacterium]MBW2047128.1 SDR family NAD(P)-dependent oxidoreductase [Deltaproteobacteria bacterium]